MKKRTITILVTAIMLLTVAAGVSASAGDVTATLSYNNIKVTLDGSPVDLSDSEGEIVEPFIIDGTTYLPVRAVAAALGLGVEWDAATNTVVLTSITDDGEAAANTPVPMPLPAPTPAPIPAQASVQIPAPAQTATPTQTLIRGRDPSVMVYVSNASDTIHSVHNCSGMKNYRTMTLAEANSRGYKYCPKCW